MTYAEWIERYVASKPSRFVRGCCQEAVEAMVQDFPELRKAAGFVYCDWGRDEHWWCVAPDGSVVDPTREQFNIVFEYEELDLNDPKTRDRVPIGRCVNCGEETYRSSYSSEVCSESCASAFTAYLNEEARRF